MWGKDNTATNVLEWKKDANNSNLYELNIKGVLDCD